jgi:hypothetical protein
MGFFGRFAIWFCMVERSRFQTFAARLLPRLDLQTRAWREVRVVLDRSKGSNERSPFFAGGSRATAWLNVVECASDRGPMARRRLPGDIVKPALDKDAVPHQTSGVPTRRTARSVAGRSSVGIEPVDAADHPGGRPRTIAGCASSFQSMTAWLGKEALARHGRRGNAVKQRGRWLGARRWARPRAEYWASATRRIGRRA